jgi:hypothetical protein
MQREKFNKILNEIVGDFFWENPFLEKLISKEDFINLIYQGLWRKYKQGICQKTDKMPIKLGWLETLLNQLKRFEEEVYFAMEDYLEQGNLYKEDITKKHLRDLEEIFFKHLRKYNLLNRYFGEKLERAFNETKHKVLKENPIRIPNLISSMIFETVAEPEYIECIFEEFKEEICERLKKETTNIMLK